MNTNEQNNREMEEAPDQRTEALRESIRLSFPDQPYTGEVTLNDNELDDPDLDEDRDLYEALKGRRWTDVPAALLHNLPDGYGLLTDPAFVAFLPAWLMYSLRDMGTENEVRNFVAYAFSQTMRQFRVLNPEQQRTVRSLLVEFADRGTSDSIKKHINEALALIDRGRY